PLLRGRAAPAPRRVAAAAGSRRGPTVSGRAGRGTTPECRSVRARRGGGVLPPGPRGRLSAGREVPRIACRAEPGAPAPASRPAGRGPPAAVGDVRLVHGGLGHPRPTGGPRSPRRAR